MGPSVATFLSCAAALLCGVQADIRGFLVISAPRNSKVSYVKLPESGSLAGLKPRTLIDTGLMHPQGIAVDQKRKKLFVADPDAKKIYSYMLAHSDDQLSTVGGQVVVSQNSEARWVAVDGLGNIFFSDEPNNLILKVSADKVLRGETTPEIIYDGNSNMQVSRPGGIAVDNFHVFWTNKDIGTQVGSVVEGSEKPTGKHTKVLAKNVLKSYGVCLALSNVYYTDSDKVIYGVKKAGGKVEQISGSLQQPRGCAWDGDGTVYVADRGANAIYSFAGNMHSLSPVVLEKSFDCDDAFGLAVVSTTSAAVRSALRALPAAVAVAAAVLFVH